MKVEWWRSIAVWKPLSAVKLTSLHLLTCMLITIVKGSDHLSDEENSAWRSEWDADHDFSSHILLLNSFFFLLSGPQ